MSNVVELEPKIPCVVCGSNDTSGQTIDVDLSVFGLGRRNLFVCNDCIAKEVAGRFSMMEDFISDEQTRENK